jgi:hypothetical protein
MTCGNSTLVGDAGNYPIVFVGANGNLSTLNNALIFGMLEVLLSAEWFTERTIHIY